MASANFELAVSGAIARTLSGYATNACAWQQIGPTNFRLAQVSITGFSFLPDGSTEPWTFALAPDNMAATALTFLPYTDGQFAFDPKGARKTVDLDAATLALTVDLDTVNVAGAAARVSGRIICNRP